MPAIGVITFELRLDDAHSLKDKRHFVKSLKDRLRAKFNVAVAEIDHQDLWQRGLIACVTVSPDQGFAEQVLQSVEREAASLLGPMLVGVTTEWLAWRYDSAMRALLIFLAFVSTAAAQAAFDPIEYIDKS